LQALSSFKLGLYDLAILDIKMPQMNGFQLYEEIRKIDRSIRICFITASSEEIYDYDAEEYRVKQKQNRLSQYCEFNRDMFLKKPVSSADLVKEVNKIIK